MGCMTNIYVNHIHMMAWVCLKMCTIVSIFCCPSTNLHIHTHLSVIYIYIHTYIWIYIYMSCHDMSCHVQSSDVMWCNDSRPEKFLIHHWHQVAPSYMAHEARRRSPQSRRTKQRWTWSVLRTADDVDVTFLERLKRRFTLPIWWFNGF